MLDEALALRDVGLRPPAPVPNERFPRLFRLLKLLATNPLEAWCRAHFEQPIVPLQLLTRRLALVSEPGAIQRVLVGNAANYPKDFLQRRVLSAGLSQGLLAVEDERWRVQRRTLAPLFSRKSVQSFAPTMLAAAEALAERWRRVAEGAAPVVDVYDDMIRITIAVLEETIFSDGLGRDPEAVRQAMADYFDMIGRIDPFDLLGVPGFVPRLTRLNAPRIRRFLDDTVDGVIARRRQRLAADPAGAPRDLLTLLLEAQDPETGAGVGDAEVKANVLTFIAAGHETTANALTWSIYLLSQAPEWRERVAGEARRLADVPAENLAERLVETRAVVDEAIRLYPPIVAVSRMALEADELAGQRIERGTIVVIAPYVLHRHRLMWVRPEIFDPGRFLGDARLAIDRFAYLPFGIGPRTCIGASFALQEAALVLAVLMREFDVSVAPGHVVWPVQRVTLRPRGGLPMVIRPRRR